MFGTQYAGFQDFMFVWTSAKTRKLSSCVGNRKRLCNTISRQNIENQKKGVEMLSLLYACFLSVWRRCFGSSGWGLPILKIRAVQHIIGFLGASIALWLCGYHWLQIIACAGVLQGLYWAKGHGMCFDYGKGEVDLNRYEKMLSWRLIRKYIPEKYWYGYASDFILMNARYTFPAVLMALVLLKPQIAFLGLIVSGVYAFFWALYDVGLTKRPTELAEYISGFLTGALLTL